MTKASDPKGDQHQAPLSGGNIGNIHARPIITEMEESYLSYAMSVIVSVRFLMRVTD